MKLKSNLISRVVITTTLLLCVAAANSAEVTIRWVGTIQSTDIRFEGQFNFPTDDPAATSIIDLLTVGTNTDVVVSDGITSQTWGYNVAAPPFDSLRFRYCPGGESQCGIPAPGAFVASFSPSWTGTPLETDCGAFTPAPCLVQVMTFVGEDPPIARVNTDISLATANFTFEIVSNPAEPFILRQTLSSNQPGFGRPVALDGNVALVGAPGGSGTASSLNIVNGNVLQTFDNPNPSTSGAVATDFYGGSVDLSSGRVLIGAQSEDIAAIDSGAAYLFDAATGDLLRTLTHPIPIDGTGGFGQDFGRGIALNGNHALIGTFRGGAFFFDVVTGELLFSFPGLSPDPESLALSEQFIAIGDITNTTGATSAGAVQLFDKATGSNLRTFFNPTPSAFDFFGRSVAIDDNRILIGAGQVDFNGISNAGEAYLFDVNTGLLMHTFRDPTQNTNAFFGRHLDIEENQIVISSEGDSEVHIFDAVSGNRLQTLTEQTPFGFFGVSVDLDQGNLLVGSVSGGAFLYGIQGPINAPPTAEAGPDQAIRAGDTVFLDGSASFDDNTATAALEYAWSFSSLPGGSTAVLLGADTAMPTFFADLTGTYAVQLVVTDEGGLTSPPDEVMISSDNLAPTANAGLDQLVIVDSTVFLDGTSSTDPESDPLTYSWMISSAPQGSTAALIGAAAAMPSFVPGLEGLYEVTLVVSEFIGPGAPDSVEIMAVSSEQFAIIAIVSAGESIVALGPEQVTTQGNQNALMNFLTQATVAIQEGDVAEAINKLQKALSRTDGCILRGNPDGNGPGRDWITDCPEQTVVYNSLNSALTALTP